MWDTEPDHKHRQSEAEPRSPPAVHTPVEPLPGTPRRHVSRPGSECPRQGGPLAVQRFSLGQVDRRSLSSFNLFAYSL